MGKGWYGMPLECEENHIYLKERSDWYDLNLSIKSFHWLYRMFIKYCVFPRIPESLPPLPRQHSAATKNYQWLYTRIALRALKA